MPHNTLAQTGGLLRLIEVNLEPSISRLDGRVRKNAEQPDGQVRAELEGRLEKATRSFLKRYAGDQFILRGQPVLQSAQPVTRTMVRSHAGKLQRASAKWRKKDYDWTGKAKDNFVSKLHALLCRENRTAIPVLWEELVIHAWFLRVNGGWVPRCEPLPDLLMFNHLADLCERREYPEDVAERFNATMTCIELLKGQRARVGGAFSPHLAAFVQEAGHVWREWTGLTDRVSHVASKTYEGDWYFQEWLNALLADHASRLKQRGAPPIRVGETALRTIQSNF